MAENATLVTEIQEQVAECRRFAAGVCDPEAARRFQELADEIERRARDVREA
jgi:hypothetical protein